MSRGISRTSGQVVFILLAGLICTGMAGAAGTVVIDLPQTGGLGHVVQPAGHAVALQGFSVMWFRGEEDFGDRDVWAIACMSDSTLRNKAGDDLAAFVSSGGGLVYLVSSDAGQISRDTPFLEKFDVQLKTRSASRELLRTPKHEIVENVNDLGDTPIPFYMFSSSQTALIRQEGQAVAIARDFGKGRLVVLPIDVVSTRRGKNNPEPDRIALLTQAMSWAAQAEHKVAEKAGEYHTGPERDHFMDKRFDKQQKQPPSGLPQPPDFAGDEIEKKQDTTPVVIPDIPGGPVTLSDTCVVDGGGKKYGWPVVWELLQDVLPNAGLEIERVPEPRDKDDARSEPLIGALPDEPSLLVLYSWRKYSWDEARAVGDHIRAGGSLLALASTDSGTQWPMQYFNRILSEFKVAASMTRPGGKAQMMRGPFTERVQFDTLPGGIGIWGFDDIEIVKAGKQTVASAVTPGDGRVFIMDAKMLWNKDKRVQREFGQLLRNAVSWLTEK
ncbi:MAG: hypothetical protein R6V19_14165 [Armatimonadota bacterium]